MENDRNNGAFNAPLLRSFSMFLWMWPILKFYKIWTSISVFHCTLNVNFISHHTSINMIFFYLSHSSFVKWDKFLKWWYCSFLMFPFLCYFAVSFSNVFSFSLISRFNFQTTIFLQEISFSWKLTHIWMGWLYMETLKGCFSSGIERDPNAKQLCLEYFHMDFLNQDSTENTFQSIWNMWMDLWWVQLQNCVPTNLQHFKTIKELQVWTNNPRFWQVCSLGKLCLILHFTLRSKESLRLYCLLK